MLIVVSPRVLSAGRSVLRLVRATEWAFRYPGSPIETRNLHLPEWRVPGGRRRDGDARQQQRSGEISQVRRLLEQVLTRQVVTTEFEDFHRHEGRHISGDVAA